MAFSVHFFVLKEKQLDKFLNEAIEVLAIFPFNQSACRLDSPLVRTTTKLSYSPIANRTSRGDPTLCFEHHVCTPSGMSFDLPFVTSDDMCSLLVSNNVKHLHFYGDSYMRHMYVATSIMLIKNYKDASHSSVNSHCEYGNQFAEEATCRALVCQQLHLVVEISNFLCNKQQIRSVIDVGKDI